MCGKEPPPHEHVEHGATDRLLGSRGHGEGERVFPDGRRQIIELFMREKICWGGVRLMCLL